MRSRIFYSDDYKEIERRVLRLLNSQEEFLSARTIHSTRAAGDAIENIVSSSFETIIGEWSSKYTANFARRAMADFAFTDNNGIYYVVDVKTHRADTNFNMPNLISVERLARFYQDDLNYFALLLISYSLDESKAVFSQVHFVPIEFLDWSCLTLGALGWGQIQIANSNCIVVNPQYPRKDWMLQLCDILLRYYPKEISKIEERIKRFQKVQEYWQVKKDL